MHTVTLIIDTLTWAARVGIVLLLPVLAWTATRRLVERCRTPNTRK